MKIIACILLVLCSPIFILVAVLIFIECGSSILFKQERIGKDHRTFTIYKFKTMVNEKITTIGKPIRKLGLDELPQLINVIIGDMSFVGPRPLTQFDIERLNWNKEEYSNRWSVKPGITGLAQLNTICSAELSMKQDLNYVREKNLFFDIRVLLRTLLVPFKGKITN
jgi:lipopolysaccharide/colanic/teichoic acid biosynthesis glycosyltransferase